MAIIQALTEPQSIELKYDWRFWARPKQLPPEGDWSTWVLRAGRGFGKTRSGTGWVQERALEQTRWIALVARNSADARDYMIEGPSGFLKIAAPHQCPQYEPSKRRLTWPNGSHATIYTDEEPEGLRGFSGDTAWLDEFGKYRYAEQTWDNLQFGMREVSADRPRRLITTTPRPLAILRQIERMASTVTVIGSSYENRTNLDPTWFRDTIAAYEGTRIGRQEIHAEILEDVPGALWTRRLLDETRVTSAPPLKRIVIGVDPAATSSENSNETGIVAAGLADNGHAYVLEDWSVRGSPDIWARKAVGLYRKWSADCLVAEVNQGGEMVAAVIRSSADIPVKSVHATRGKIKRAEPISAIYEQERVHHVGVLPELEDQMISFVPGNEDKERSPDRMDAAVWALTELFPDIVDRVEPKNFAADLLRGAYFGM